MNPVRRFFTAATLLMIATWDVHAQARPPIIDMHLHARGADYAGTHPPPMCTPFERMPLWNPRASIEEMQFNHGPPCKHPIPAARTDDEVLRDTIAVMKKRNIIGMVSGEPELLTQWRAAAPDRIIPGIDLRIGVDASQAHVAPRTVAELKALYERGMLGVLGEVMVQYEGLTPGDSRLEPYWEFAEANDIPVGISIYPGSRFRGNDGMATSSRPGDSYAGSGGYRARNGSPLPLEDVLVRHPHLRVYIMHAGNPFIADLRAVLFAHPQVYVDISGIVYTEPRAAFYNFLRELVASGYGDRVMFGSDQMVWPGVIEPSIQAIEEAGFLTATQKRDILYNNAARFLRLSPETMRKHAQM
jgi:predicted TIM-barrel fold metal-dependent hydrolase